MPILQTPSVQPLKEVSAANSQFFSQETCVAQRAGTVPVDSWFGNYPRGSRTVFIAAFNNRIGQLALVAANSR
jgi:hypothetical protein